MAETPKRAGGSEDLGKALDGGSAEERLWKNLEVKCRSDHMIHGTATDLTLHLTSGAARCMRRAAPTSSIQRLQNTFCSRCLLR
jgi:hypothetical protein